MILFFENVFPTLVVMFFAKNQKIFKFGKITKFDEEKVIFEKKPILSFQEESLTKLVGRKYTGGSQPSCYAKT